MLCIIDFGMGNLRSINRKLRSVGISSVISSDAKVISSADMLILPGVGNFANAMRHRVKFLTLLVIIVSPFIFTKKLKK